jgi:hypothetical protein
MEKHKDVDQSAVGEVFEEAEEAAKRVDRDPGKNEERGEAADALKPSPDAQQSNDEH